MIQLQFEHQAEWKYVISVTKLLINHGTENSYQRTSGKTSNGKQNFIIVGTTRRYFRTAA